MGDFVFQTWVKSESVHIQLRIDTGDADENAALFDELANSREQVDAEFGPGLQWNRADDHRACFVRYDVPKSCGWKTPPDERMPGHEAVADALDRFHSLLEPIVSAIS